MFEQNLGTRVNAVRNQSVGNLVIYNLKEEDVGIDPDLKKFFGVGEKHGTGTYIIREAPMKESTTLLSTSCVT